MNTVSAAASSVAVYTYILLYSYIRFCDTCVVYVQAGLVIRHGYVPEKCRANRTQIPI